MIGGGSIRVSSDDLEWPLTQFSRSRYTYKSNISQMVRDFWILHHTVADHRGSTENMGSSLKIFHSQN